MSLFPPPKDVKTEIFARVPDEFRKSGGRPSGRSQYTGAGY